MNKVEPHKDSTNSVEHRADQPAQTSHQEKLSNSNHATPISTGTTLLTISSPELPEVPLRHAPLGSMVLHSLPEVEWIDWLGALHGPLPIQLVTQTRPDLDGPFILLGAEFAPFDDLIEIVLLVDSRERRVFIDNPLGLWTDSNPPIGQWHARIETRFDSISMGVAAFARRTRDPAAGTYVRNHASSSHDRSRPETANLCGPHPGAGLPTAAASSPTYGSFLARKGIGTPAGPS